MKTPQESLAKFERDEREYKEIIDTYVQDNKRNYEELDGTAKRLRGPTGCRLLSATNSQARIETARRATAEIGTLRKRESRDCPKVSEVTLVPSKYAVPESDAHRFSAAEFATVVQRHFGNHNYIGVIEGALYPRLRNGLRKNRGTVSWHAHLLVWSANPENLLYDMVRFNDGRKSLVHGLPASHLATRSWKSFAARFLYALKSPCKQYTIGGGGESVNSETGEIVQVPGIQNSETMRPGQRVRMCNVLRDQFLDWLVIAGGTGVKVKNAIFDDLLKRLPDESRQSRLDAVRLDGRRERTKRHRRQDR